MAEKMRDSAIDSGVFKAGSDSLVFERTLESFGALAAAGIVRRNFPSKMEHARVFDQHHDNDNDISVRFREMMAG